MSLKQCGPRAGLSPTQIIVRDHAESSVPRPPRDALYISQDIRCPCVAPLDSTLTRTQLPRTTMSTSPNQPSVLDETLPPTQRQFSPSSSLLGSASGSNERASGSGSVTSRSRSPPSRDGERSDDPKSSPRATPTAIAPEQPLTARGKPRERVYLACEQW